MVRKIGKLEESGIKLQCSNEDRETTFGSSYREVRKYEDSRNQDFTVEYWNALSSFVCQVGTFKKIAQKRRSRALLALLERSKMYSHMHT